MKRKSQKRAAAFLAGLLLCLSLSACTETGEEPVPVEAVGNRNTIIVYYDSIKNFESTDKIINTFNNESPSTRVSVQYWVDGQYREKLEQALAAGDGPDCFYIEHAGASNKMAAMGKLMDLTDFVHSSSLNLANYGAAMETVMQGEQLYSLPRSKNSWILYYNKDYFDKRGVPYPQQLTWEEFAALARRLTYVDTPTGKTYWGGFVSPELMNLGGVAAGEYLTDDELPVTESYVKLLHRLYNEDLSCPGLFEMSKDYNEPFRLFEAGQIAMAVYPDWGVSRLSEELTQKAISMNWDVAPLPVFEFVEENTTVGSYTYMGMSAATEYGANAFEFMSTLCGARGASTMVKNNTYPAYLTDASSLELLGSIKLPGARLLSQSTVLNAENSHSAYGEISERFASEMELYLGDLKEPEAAFARFFEIRREILER